jgi:hypothetical protein
VHRKHNKNRTPGGFFSLKIQAKNIFITTIFGIRSAAQRRADSVAHSKGFTRRFRLHVKELSRESIGMTN